MKPIKEVLYLTDDLDEMILKREKKRIESGIYFYHKEENWLKFKLTISREFADFIDHYQVFDAILVDYGLLGTRFPGYSRRNELAVKFLKKVYLKSEIKLAWVGALSGRYNDDAKRFFPEYEFLHNLPYADIGSENILFLLYDLFKRII